MYNKYSWLNILILIAFVFQGCKVADEFANDTTAPTFSVPTNVIHWVPGRELIITGTATDDTGIKSVRLVQPDWGFDQTVTFGKGLVKSFELKYPYTIPNDATNIEYVVTILITDMADNVTTEKLSVFLDGDLDAPVFVKVPTEVLELVGRTGMTYTLNFNMTDNQSLAYLLIKCPELSINDSILLNGTTSTYNKVLSLGATEAVYNFTYTLGDAFNLISTKQSKITVGKTPDFANMYLTDVFTEEQLVADEFGVPVIMDKNGAYNYSVIYYSKTAGTKIKFIPQAASLSPNCFGLLDGQVANDPTASEFVLPDQGYYTVSLNISTSTYTAIPYTPTLAKKGIYLAGEKFSLGAWLVDATTLMTPNTDNYVVSKDFTTQSGCSFCFTTSGWSTTWKPLGTHTGDGLIFGTAEKSWNYFTKSVGDYTVTYDYLTGRGVLIKK